MDTVSDQGIGTNPEAQRAQTAQLNKVGRREQEQNVRNICVIIAIYLSVSRNAKSKPQPAISNAYTQILSFHDNQLQGEGQTARKNKSHQLQSQINTTL